MQAFNCATNDDCGELKFLVLKLYLCRIAGGRGFAS